jgi:hypothetical protein
MNRAALTAILLLSSLVAISQDRKDSHPTKVYEVGGSIGRPQYFGDLYDRASYASSGGNWSIAGFIRRQVNPYTSLRVNIGFGGLSANDLDDPKHRWDYRRAQFKTSYMEVAGVVELYPLARIFPSGRLSPYVFAGIGSLFTDPKVNIQPGGMFPPSGELLAQDKQQLKKVAGVFPVGIGINYMINPKLKAGLEMGYRYTTSDYIDGFSAASHQNSLHNDSYIIAAVQVSYRLHSPRPSLNPAGYLDADNDGIIDSDDSCPDEFGDPATCGCPDDDHDGVPNACDCCPTEPGDRAYHGCPKSHSIEYNHVRLPNTLRYCPLCPTDLPNASKLQKPNPLLPNLFKTR